MMSDAGAAVLVTEERFSSLAPDPATRRVLLDADRDRIGAEDTAAPDVAVDGANPAYVIYTSGSLGRPKGVVVPHRALANFAHALAAATGLGPGERILEFASLSFDASALQIFPALLSGATLVLDRHPGRLSAAEVLELCERQEVTVLDLPAAVWRQWIDAMAGREARLPARIRTFLTGGESLPADKLRSWARMTAAGARLFSSYGPTEATVTTTLFGIASDAATDFALAKVPLGSPLPNTRIHLLDAHRRPVPAGVPGEVYIGGRDLARGYLGRPELTAEVFVPSPESREPGERLYRTGDLARRLAGGGLEFLGRIDHQVKIRGVRVEPGEVQAALGQHPAVRQCVVIAREEPSGDRRLAAYLVAEEPAPGVTELRGFLAGRLPEAMIPSSFTLLPELPLLPSGKVDLRALPAPSLERPDLGRTFVPPGNALEEVLADLFRKVLGVDRVGIHDDFFALGGHSLLAAQAIGRARDLLQTEIQLRQLFEAPTVAGLSALLLAEDAERQRLLEVAEILVTVDRLSSEEVEAMLAQDASATPESELA
jgi:amino acid adenylation domain-containing protein